MIRRLRDYDDLITTLRRAWLDQDLTLDEVGERVGCHRNRVSVALNGTEEPRSRRLLALIGALGYDLALVKRDQPCPTCQGPSRETVDMVCQSCGTDYGPKEPS